MKSETVERRAREKRLVVEAAAGRVAARRASRKEAKREAFLATDARLGVTKMAARFSGPVVAGTLRASVIEVLARNPDGISLPEAMEVVTSVGTRPHTMDGVHRLLKQHGVLGGDGLWRSPVDGCRPVVQGLLEGPRGKGYP